MMLTGSSHQLCRALTGLAVCSHLASGMHPPACHMPPGSSAFSLNVECRKERECSSVLSFSDLRSHRASFRQPRRRARHRSPPDENGAARYCLAILASLGHVVSCSFQYFNKSRSMSVSSGDNRYSSSSSRTGTTVASRASRPSYRQAPPVWRLGQRLAGLCHRCRRGRGFGCGVWAWPQSHARGRRRL